MSSCQSWPTLEVLLAAACWQYGYSCRSREVRVGRCNLQCFASQCQHVQFGGACCVHVPVERVLNEMSGKPLLCTRCLDAQSNALLQFAASPKNLSCALGNTVSEDCALDRGERERRMKLFAQPGLDRCSTAVARAYGLQHRMYGAATTSSRMYTVKYNFSGTAAVVRALVPECERLNFRTCEQRIF